MPERDVLGVYGLGEEPEWSRSRPTRRAEKVLVNGYWRTRLVPVIGRTSRNACLVPPVGPRLARSLNGRVGEGRR